MSFTLIPTLYDDELCDPMVADQCIDYSTAEKIFTHFAQLTFLKWGSTHNFCEARAEAASLLLNAAKIPHAKAWVFGGLFVRSNHVGALINYWNFHVAVAVPVITNGIVQWYVIDPSMNAGPVLLYNWAASVTLYAHSYHCLKNPSYYIFPNGNIVKKKWHHRGHRNFKWTMQCLAGINGLTYFGKAQLVFKKKKIAATKKLFLQARKNIRHGW